MTKQTLQLLDGLLQQGTSASCLQLEKEGREGEKFHRLSLLEHGGKVHTPAPEEGGHMWGP